ncbi:GlxA family transcriptional regulator [Neorhizobium sp. NPDC001467]|uniref:GlxA family transcriptional regulator n=1 Tax=Neorhizobium sp. NPDC001467 TaxID=3390595 RepID=UPI003D004E92
MRIAILAYDGISPFMLSTPLAVSGEAWSANNSEVLVCAETPRLTAIGGMSIETAFDLRDARKADVLILPGWRNADEPVSAPIIDATLDADARSAIVVGLCLGAYGLAEAGLLDGKRATTHWAMLDAFAARYPRVAVDRGAIFVDEGRLLTSAGIASGLDCCLHLLARLCGSAQANRVARHLVVASQRSGGQPQFIERPAPNSSGERRAAKILEDLLADPSDVPSLTDLATRAGMSRRSLSRHIRAQTGDSLGAWLRRARVALAQDLILKGATGLDQIAARCGFADAKSMRMAFRTEAGVSPRQWQARQRLD